MADAAEVDVALSQVDDVFADPSCSWEPSGAGPGDVAAVSAWAGLVGALRVPYPVTQRIAPLVAGRLPRASEFFPVRCHDLSTGGFSFFLDHVPDFDKLVTAIGGPSTAAYVVARVAHCREAVGSAGNSMHRGVPEPAPRFLVGCQFVRRLDACELPEDFSHHS